MKITVTNKELNSAKGSIGVCIYQDKLKKFPKDIIQDKIVEKIYYKHIKNKEEEIKSAETFYIYSVSDNPVDRVFFIVLGKSTKTTIEDFRVAGASLAKNLKKAKISSISIQFPDLDKLKPTELRDRIQGFVEGFMLRNYDFSKYCQKPHEIDIKELKIHEPNKKKHKVIKEGVDLGLILSDATNLCRDIANEPANFMTPEEMARISVEVAKKYDSLSCYVLDEKELAKKGLTLFLSVAQSGSAPPRLICLEYKCGKNKAKTVGILGKGVTFDSGGISLKQAPGMFQMKRDLSGGASAIAVMEAIARLELPINVVSIIGATENMPGSQALKPGDVIKSLSGKTVEIISTDAEGRLVLGDIMTYMQREHKPDYMLDIATLTGGVSRAIGESISAVFANNRKFCNYVKKASEKENEHLWEFPLFQEYKKAIKSYFADMKNSSRQMPGTIIAALFLQQFVEKNIPWIHLDIASTDTASGEPSTYYPRGATGVMTRTIVEMLREMSKGK